MIALKHALHVREAPFQVLQVLLDHLAEDAVPFESSSFFLEDLMRISDHDTLVAEVSKGLQTVQQEGGDGLMTFMNDARRMVGDRSAEETTIDKRSTAGLFIRRTWLAFHRLPYHGVLALLRDIVKWCHGPVNEESMVDEKEKVPDVGMPDHLRWRAEAMLDDDLELLPARFDAFDEYERALKAGDHIAAHDSLRRFFDYRFGKLSMMRPLPGSRAPAQKPKERILHQQALLNLANLHLQERGFLECRMAVEEAARIARQVIDKDCLAACKSLLLRLEMEDPPPLPELHNEPDRLPASALPPPPNPTPTDYRHRTAIDELWAIERGLHNGVPLHILIGGPLATLLGNLLRTKTAGHRETVVAGLGEMIGGRMTWNKAAWHAMASELYALAVQPLLSEVHHKLAIEANATEDVRIALQAAKADKLARAGHFNEAIKLLLDEAPLLSSASIKDVTRWQRAVYSLYRIRAERGAFPLVVDQIARACPPPLTTFEMSLASADSTRPSYLEGIEDELPTSAPAHARALLKRGQKLLEAGDLVTAIKPILEAISRTETSDTGQGLVTFHTRARALLAQWLADSGEFAKAKAELDRSSGLETLARAMEDAQLVAEIQWTRGRALIGLAHEASHTSTSTREDLLQQAGKVFTQAEQKASQAGCYTLRRQILSDLAVLYHQTGLADQRDVCADLWASLAQRRREAERALLQELSLATAFMANASAEAASVLQ